MDHKFQIYDHHFVLRNCSFVTCWYRDGGLAIVSRRLVLIVAASMRVVLLWVDDAVMIPPIVRSVVYRCVIACSYFKRPQD